MPEQPDAPPPRPVRLAVRTLHVHSALVALGGLVGAGLCVKISGELEETGFQFLGYIGVFLCVLIAGAGLGGIGLARGLSRRRVLAYIGAVVLECLFGSVAAVYFLFTGMRLHWSAILYAFVLATVLFALSQLLSAQARAYFHRT